MFRRLRRRSKRLSQKVKNSPAAKNYFRLTLENLEQRLLLDTAGLWDEIGWRSGSGGGISYDPAGDQAEAKMVLSSDGDPVILWVEGATGSLQEYIDTPVPYHWQMEGPIYARQYADDIGWWDFTSGSGDTVAIGTGSQIDAASGAHGQIAVVWVGQASGDTGGDNEIYLRLWNGESWVALAGSASGGGVSNDTVLNEKPSVAMNNLGEIFVSYTAVHPLSNQREIVVKKYGYDYLSPIGPPQPGDLKWIELVNAGVGLFGESATKKTAGVSNDNAKSFDSSIIVDLVGKPIVVWASAISQANTEIYLKRWDGDSWEKLGVESAFDLNGDGNSGVSNNATQSLQPDVAIGPTGDIFVTWVNWTHEGWINYDNHIASEGAEVLVKVFDHGQNPGTDYWQYYATGSTSGADLENIGSFDNDAVGMGWYYSPTIQIDSTNQPFIVWQGFGNGERNFYNRDNSTDGSREYPGMAVYASHGQFNGTSNEFVLLSDDFRGVANKYWSVSNLAWMPAAVVGPNDELIIAYTWHDADNSHDDDEIFVQKWEDSLFEWTEYGRSSASNGNDLWGYFEDYSGDIHLGLLDYDEDPATPQDVIVAVPVGSGNNSGELYRYSRQTGEWYKDIDLPEYERTADYDPPYEGSFGFIFDLRGEPEVEFGNLPDSKPVLAFLDDATGEPYVYEWNNGGWEFVGEVDAEGRPTAETDINGNHIAAAGTLVPQTILESTFSTTTEGWNFVSDSNEPSVTTGTWAADAGKTGGDGGLAISFDESSANDDEDDYRGYYQKTFNLQNDADLYVNLSYEIEASATLAAGDTLDLMVWVDGRAVTDIGDYQVTSSSGDTGYLDIVGLSLGWLSWGTHTIAIGGILTDATDVGDSTGTIRLDNITIKQPSIYEISVQMGPNNTMLLAYRTDNLVWPDDPTSDIRSEVIVRYWDGGEWIDAGSGYAPVSEPLETLFYSQFDGYGWGDDYLGGLTKVAYDTTTGLQTTIYEPDNWYFWHGGRAASGYPVAGDISDTAGQFYQPGIEGVVPEVPDSGLELIFTIDPEAANYDNLIGQTIKGVFDYQFELNIPADVIIQLAYELDASTYLNDDGSVDMTGEALGELGLYMTIDGEVVSDSGVLVTVNDISNIDGYSIDQPIASINPRNYETLLEYDNYTKDSARMTGKLGYLTNAIMMIDVTTELGHLLTAGEHTLQIWAQTVVPQLIYESTFSNDIDGWTFEPDIYEPEVTTATWDDEAGETGADGGLIINFDEALTQNDQDNYQGWFSNSLMLQEDTEVYLNLSFEIEASDTLAAGDTLDLVILVDDVAITAIGDYQVTSGGGDIGYLDITDLSLGELAAGTHTISIGGILTDTTDAGDSTGIMRLDNFKIYYVTTSDFTTPGTGDWEFIDDVNEPYTTHGEWDSDVGETGFGDGGLWVGFFEDNTITNQDTYVSGFEKTINIGQSQTAASLDLSYALMTFFDIVSTDTLDLTVWVDGVAVTSIGDYQVTGTDYTGYLDITDLSLGDLDRGIHTISIGGILTDNDDISTSQGYILLDNINVELTPVDSDFNYDSDPRLGGWTGVFDDEVSGGYASDADELDGAVADGVVTGSDDISESGGLQIILGDGTGGGNLQGAFDYEFIMAGDTEIEFSYQITAGAAIPEGETVVLMVYIDGQPITSPDGSDGDNRTYIVLDVEEASINQDGELEISDSDWQSVTFNLEGTGNEFPGLDTLGPGTHTLRIRAILSQSAEAGEGDTIENTFASNANPWTTEDADLCTWQATAGNGGGGGLQIALGDPDQAESNLEATWQREFELSNAATVSLDLDYALTRGAALIASLETLDFYYSIDEGDQIQIASLAGAAGNLAYTSAPQIDLGWLPSGIHTIELVGALTNSGDSGAGETATIKFDNVILTPFISLSDASATVRLDNVIITGGEQTATVRIDNFTLYPRIVSGEGYAFFDDEMDWVFDFDPEDAYSEGSYNELGRRLVDDGNLEIALGNGIDVESDITGYYQKTIYVDNPNNLVIDLWYQLEIGQELISGETLDLEVWIDDMQLDLSMGFLDGDYLQMVGGNAKDGEAGWHRLVIDTTVAGVLPGALTTGEHVISIGGRLSDSPLSGGDLGDFDFEDWQYTSQTGLNTASDPVSSDTWYTYDSPNASWQEGTGGGSDVLQFVLGQADVEESDLEYSWWTYANIPYTSKVIFSLDFEMFTGSDLDGQSLELYLEVDDQKNDRINIGELIGGDGVWIYARHDIELEDWFTAGSHKFELVAYLSGSPIADDSTAIINFDNVTITQQVNPGVIKLDDIYISGTGRGSDAWEFQPAHPPDELVGGGNDFVGPDADSATPGWQATYDFQADLHLAVAEPLATDSYIIPHIVTSGRESNMEIGFRYRLTGFNSQIRVLIDGVPYNENGLPGYLTPPSYANDEHWYDGDDVDPEYTWVTVNASNIPQGDHVITIELTAGIAAFVDAPDNLWIDNLTILGTRESSYTHAEDLKATLLATGTGGTRNFAIGNTNITPGIYLYNDDDDIDPDAQIWNYNGWEFSDYEGYQNVSIYQYDAASDSWSQYATDFGEYVNIDFSGVGADTIPMPGGANQYRLDDLAIGPNQVEWILVQRAAADFRTINTVDWFLIHPWTSDAYGAGIAYDVQVQQWQPFQDPRTGSGVGWQDTGFTTGDEHSSNGQLVSSGGQFPTAAWTQRITSTGGWGGSSALRYEGVVGGVNTWGVLGTRSVQGIYGWGAASMMDMIVGPDDGPIVAYYAMHMECNAVREFIRTSDLPDMTITENSGTTNDNLLEFGSTTDDIPYLYQTIHISNTGPGPLEIYSIEFDGFGDIANPFSVLVGSKGTPDYPVTLAGAVAGGQAGERLSLVVRLNPADIPSGEYHGVMLIHTSNPTHPTHPYGHYYDVSIQFEILSEAEVSVAPTYVEFDDTVINQHWAFSNHSEGWTTADTVNAAWNIDAGYSGKGDGGLQIALGEANKIQTNLEYSWEKVFYLTDDSHVTLDFAYAMTRGSDLINPVTGKTLGLYYSIDGGPAVLIEDLTGAETNRVYASLVTPLNLGDLAAGEHTLEIIATLSASPASNNSTALVKFDNVTINDYTQDEIQEIVIRNSGTDELVIHELAFAGAGFRILNDVEDGVAGAVVSWMENGIVHTTEYSSQILKDITIPAAIDAKLTLKVVFEPDEVTTYSDTLYIHTNDSDEEYISVRFQGAGVSGSSILVTAAGIADPLEPTDSELDFGSVRFGDQSTITLTIENTGNTNLTIYNVSTSVNPDLSIVVERNGQILGLVANEVLGRDDLLTVYVTYAPTSAGQTGTIVPEALSSMLLIQSDAAELESRQYLISIIGLGVPQKPTIKILENSGVKANDRNVDFGSVRVGQSYTQTFQIANIGGDTLRVKYFRIDKSSGQITIDPNNLPNNDADDIIIPYRGDPVDVTVTFAPTAAGAIYDQLFVYYLDADGKVVSTNSTIQFIGMGIAPGFEVTDENYNLIDKDTGELDFSNVWVGQSSQKKIILRNTGNDTLTISAWTDLVGVFSAASNPPGSAGDITLGPGHDYELTITFTPDAAGDFPQSFVITSNDPSAPTWQFNLLGEGDTPGQVFITDLQGNSLSEINFTELYGPLIYGQNMITEGFRINNTGGSTLRIKGISTSSPFRLNSVLSTADSKDDIILDPDEYYNVYVTFSANNQFDGSKTVTVVTNDGVSSDLTTNIVLTGKTVTLSYVGGINGKRANWFDDDNHLITVILTGDGTATIVPKELGVPSGDIDYILLSGTTAKTSLTLICSAGTGIGGIISDTGILKNITFKGDVKLDGAGIQLAALGDKLTIGDLINGADINIGATYGKGVKIKTGNIGDNSDVLVQGNVASFDSVSFGSGLFEADYARKIKIKSGEIDGKFVIDGDLDNLDAGKSAFQGVVSALNINNIKLGSMSGATVTVESLLNKLTCLGNMDNSFVLGGYKLGDDHLLGGSGSNADSLVASSYLKSVSIGGRFAGSYVTAGIKGVAPNGTIDFFTAPLDLRSGYIGKVSFGGVYDYNAGTLFGVGATSSIDSVKDGSENVTIDEAPFGDPWSGDFVAREFGLL